MHALNNWNHFQTFLPKYNTNPISTLRIYDKSSSVCEKPFLVLRRLKNIAYYTYKKV